MSEIIAKYTADTKGLKQVLVGLTIFLVTIFSVAGVVGGNDWKVILMTSTVVPLTFLCLLWLYATRNMFEHEWVITGDGVAVFRKGRQKHLILWDEITKVTGYPLRVIARDGRKIAFSLPPKLQREAHEKISTTLKQKRNL